MGRFNNGGIIGVENEPNASKSSGIWDLHKVFIARLKNKWSPVFFNIEYLAVGAGGGGGNGQNEVVYNAGGGGGEVLSGNVVLGESPVDVSIGEGGTGAGNADASDGQPTTFKDITALGGSGAGQGIATTGLGGTSGTGFSGGARSGGTGAGGGGGAGGAGSNGSGSTGGAGGVGILSSITGSSVGYGGGGGGGAITNAGAAADGGGSKDNGINAEANRGGGGGASSGNGGNGGSGVVILRYSNRILATLSGTLTGITSSVGEDTVLHITSGTGTVSFEQIY